MFDVYIHDVDLQMNIYANIITNVIFIHMIYTYDNNGIIMFVVYKHHNSDLQIDKMDTKNGHSFMKNI